ncbi:hypothetical protein IM697_39535 [Streptomyces ferrugineus]|uniref:DUF3592 domain-containing protein n=1 Tax=Streptomyces ferrugineus TaxID=1413221 RepID=A0A7M2SJ63_9ACTN|nr:hypothetical protein [Streptomyces ferrugineus]QOV36059.1 hypothetical protein IM697_39535 [Streptomyces ferrugineus]
MTDAHSGPEYGDDRPGAVPDTSYRALMWGPANFTGPPPRRLIVEGIALGLGGAALIAGSGVAGVLTGHRLPALVAGIAVALAAAAYLFFTNAGRVLVAVVAVFGALLAWWVPQITEEAVLAERGVTRSVVVTEVDTHRYEGRDYVQNSCTVELADGTPVAAEAWRTCTLSTRPGDHLDMVFDPDGVVAPTDRSLPGSAAEAGWRPAAFALLLAAVCCVAVVRSQP